MDERQDKSFNDAERKADGKFGLFVARVALKTVLVFVVLFALLFSVGGGMFPRAYMDLYRSVGMYGKAAAYASLAASRLADSHPEDCAGGCEYMSVLSTGIGLASMDCRGRGQSALLLYEMTGEYMASPCASAHSTAMDALALDEYSSDFITLSTVYGYADYVAGEHVRAACLTDNADAEGDAIAEALEDAIVTDSFLINVGTEYFGALVEDGRTSWFDAERYGSARVLYFKFVADAEALPAETTKDIAVKCSRLYRLVLLAETMADVERVIASDDGADADVRELAEEDVFGDAETGRVQKLYMDLIVSR